MTKQEIERELKKFNAGAMVINQAELMTALRKGRKAINELTDGLAYMNGKSKDYLVKDVAHRIAERMER